ncbi:MAG TPA: hypothetical protein ENK86_04275 [Campylobacterales bacterium]|nr:hypothetical protein [Campylobacterales bacterium]
MEFKKALKQIKKAMIAQEKASRPQAPLPTREEEIQGECLCTDSQQQFKTLYTTELEANHQAKFLYDEQGVYLIVYPCPTSSGWHLTKG